MNRKRAAFLRYQAHIVGTGFGAAMVLKAASLLITCLCLLGCARIYRPITVVPVPIPAAQGEVRPSVQFQPWGDNSGYMEKAQEKGIQMMVLSVANGTDQPVQVSLDRGSIPGEWLSASQARALVNQRLLGYAAYPVGSLIVFPPGQTGSWSVVPTVVSILAFGVNLTIGITNAAVAAASNSKLESFFNRNAWTDGACLPRETRRGLILFRAVPPLRPASLRLRVEDGMGSRTLELPLSLEP